MGLLYHRPAERINLITVLEVILTGRQHASEIIMFVKKEFLTMNESGKDAKQRIAPNLRDVAVLDSVQSRF